MKKTISIALLLMLGASLMAEIDGARSRHAHCADAPRWAGDGGTADEDGRDTCANATVTL